MPAFPLTDSAPAIRRFLLALLVFGLVGTSVELVLLEHYEDTPQLVPLGVIGLALVSIAVHLVSGGPGSIRMLRIVMGLVVLAGGLGVLLHYRGSLEFQIEMDPTLAGWDLVTRVLHAKAPPTLAPGVMAQLGLLGLVYTYRHPSLARRSIPSSPGVRS